MSDWEKDVEAFLNVVRNIPATWTCLDCKREFDNGPYGEMPWAVRRRQVCGADGVWHNRVEGDVCKACAERPYAPGGTENG